MKRLRAWVLRLASMFAKDRRERELAAEIDSHLQLHMDDNLRAGMTPEQARRDAVLKLGGVEAAKEACRERSTIPLLEHLLQDIRFAIRQLRKNPGFTTTAIVMIALGMGASLAIFGFVDAALIKPLPYPKPNRLVAVTESIPLIPRAALSYLDYLDWKRLNKVFRSLDVYTGSGYLLKTPAGSEPVRAVRVSDGFFRTLGVAPVLGRDFYAGEDLPGKPNAVILTYGAWQKRFGGRRDVIGKSILLSEVPNTVVGVLPRGFEFAPQGGAEIWAPLQASRSCETRRSCHNLEGIARLKDGVSDEAALAEMKVIAQQLERQYPDSNRGQGASVDPLSEVVVGDIRPILLVLLGGAGLLLVIASVNVASLLLVRGESRRREMAVRSALGGSRVRLFSQFATEGTVLVVAGSLLGLAFAHWAMQLLTKLVPEDMKNGMPFLEGLGLNWHLVLAAAVLALLAAALFSITPALRLPAAELRQELAEGSRGSASLTWRRLGSNLVVLELAIAVVLLVGSGLLAKSLYQLLRVELGFQPDHLATLHMAAPPSRYSKDDVMVALGRQIVRRLSSLPGVKSAAIASTLPVSFNGNTDWIRFVGRPYSGEHNEVNERDVSSAYFTTLGAKLLRGRFFTDAEDESKPGVVIINQALARKYFPGEDPIGKKVGDIKLSPKSIKEIIGIVDDIKEGALDSEIWPAEYHPFNQDPGSDYSLIVRTSQSPESMLLTLDQTVRKIDPSIGTVDEASMTQRIHDSPSAYLHRSSAWLVGGFAALALLLSVVGLYGVIAYSVSQRTREIGVRIALGAQRGTVYELILKEAARLAVTGIVAGLLGSLAAATLIRKLLFNTQTWDIPTLATVAVVLTVSALLASYIPARRAASVDPVEALRIE